MRRESLPTTSSRAAAALPPPIPTCITLSSKDAHLKDNAEEAGWREKHRCEREARHMADMHKEKERQKDAKRKREEGAKLRQKRLDWIPTSSSKIGTMLREHGEFLVPHRFSNVLPVVPSDPKLLSVSFNREAFVNYRSDSTSEQKYDLLAEPDLGIPIDLVDPQEYEAPDRAMIEAADVELLLDVDMQQAAAARGASASRVKQQMRTEVTWLRKTPIMGNNLYEAVHKPQKQNTERQHLVSASRELATVQGKPTLQEQVDAIEKTFEDAAALDMYDGVAAAQHPSKPELTPVTVLPVLPDFECWCNNYVLMSFDTDPSQDVGSSAQAAQTRCADALIRGFTKNEQVGGNEIKTSFLAYMLPKQAEEEEPQRQFEWVREYQFDMRPKDKDATGYFLSMHRGQVVYNEYTSKMAMTRKNVREVHRIKPSRISVSRRDLEETEVMERQRAKKDSGRFLLPAPQQVLALVHKE